MTIDEIDSATAGYAIPSAVRVGFHLDEDTHAEGPGPTRVGLRIDAEGGRVRLRRVLPAIESLGFEILEERASKVMWAGAGSAPDGADPDGSTYRYDFDLMATPSSPRIHYGEPHFSRLSAAFDAMWQGLAEADAFNTLVATAGLGWRETVVLRAYGRYLRQTPLPCSQRRIEAVLLANPDAARAAVDLFTARFDPAIAQAGRPDLVDAARADVERILARASDMDTDRVLRSYLSLIVNTVRTNFFCEDALTAEQPYLSLKLASETIDILPNPRPLFEIFVYSPDFEGVHLRFGKTARGGIRWSDRVDDYRTEVLGLAKTQSAKNAVIVPAGAKGGFVLRSAVSPAAVRTCYSQFISGLLDITDNYGDSSVVMHPQRVVCHDDPDPYLVVAADKGTASFSDLANELAQRHGFWLDDAFASGGSSGYDHKKIGITARGAWVSVVRHLREIGIDPVGDPVTVVGIGDMSGDVFGNGMLISDSIKLVAAFDHRHIFIDPTPEPALSHTERRRLFTTPNSTWDDYDRSLISAGGGVWRRDSGGVDLPAEAAAALGLTGVSGPVPPTEIIRAILRAPVDLLWNGGVGTYVKSRRETDAAVGDKVNDSVRVNADELCTKVVGEGGNLGFTAAARIDYARRGGRINSDAIDNAGGVDCSDHEVNIKIQIASDARLGTTVDRGALMLSMADEVTEAVLRNNLVQNRTLAAAVFGARTHLDVHARMVSRLETSYGLDRELESLPSTAVFADLANTAGALASPELASLLAHTKLALKADLEHDRVLEDDWLMGRLPTYFPKTLREHGTDFGLHPLRSAILATQAVNEVVEFGGIEFCHRLFEDTGATAADSVRAGSIAREIFELDKLQERILTCGLDPDLENELIHEGRRLLNRGARWLLFNRPSPLDIGGEIARFAEIGDLLGEAKNWLVGTEAATLDEARDQWIRQGAPDDVACRISEALFHYCLLDICESASDINVGTRELGRTYFALSDHLGIDKLLLAVSALPRDGQWESLARLTLRDDLYQSLKLITQEVVSQHMFDGDIAAAIEDWSTCNALRIARSRSVLTAVHDSRCADLSGLTVAARQVRSMTRGYPGTSGSHTP